MSEAPHKWPWPWAWRLTCQGHSPSSASVPPTTRACLVNDRSPQSGEGTENQNEVTEHEKGIHCAQGDCSAQESPRGMRSNTRAEGCEASWLLRPPLILHLPIQCCTAQVHQDSRHQSLCSGSVWCRLPRFPCPVLPPAQSTVHGDTKATQPALLGHTGCSLRDAWMKPKPCLVLGQLGSSSSEALTQGYLPLEQPVCRLCLGGADMLAGFPWNSVLMPSCTVGTGLGE